MHIVAVQLEIAWENKLRNRQAVEQLSDQASVEPDSLIVLPEMFETGFSMDLSATAQSEQRESEQFVRDVARRHRSAVLAGVVNCQRTKTGNWRFVRSQIEFAADQQH